MRVSGLISGVEVTHSRVKSQKNFVDAEQNIEVCFSELTDLVAAVQATHKARRSWSAQSFEKRKQKILNFEHPLLAEFEKLRELELMQSGQDQKIVDRHIRAAKEEISNFFREVENQEEFYGTPVGIVGVVSDFENCAFWSIHKVLIGLLAGNGVFVLGNGDQNLALSHLLRVLFEYEPSFTGLVHFLISEDPELREFFVRHPAIASLVIKTNYEEGLQFKKILSDSFKKLSLELGGRGVGIILDDIGPEHYETLAEGIINYDFFSRTRPSRLFVVEKKIEEFERELKQALTARAEVLQLSHSLREDAFVGSWEKSLREEGRELLHPEKIENNGAVSFLPGIVHELPNCAELQQEPVEGPFVSISRVKYPAEAVKFANTTHLGSHGSIWTAKRERFEKLSGGLEVPFISHNGWRINRLRQGLFSFKTSFWSSSSSVMELFSFGKYRK